jgi:hypothetical protein
MISIGCKIVQTYIKGILKILSRFRHGGEVQVFEDN